MHQYIFVEQHLQTCHFYADQGKRWREKSEESVQEADGEHGKWNLHSELARPKRISENRICGDKWQR